MKHAFEMTLAIMIRITEFHIVQYRRSKIVGVIHIQTYRQQGIP
jgi:hypothetical protein